MHGAECQQALRIGGTIFGDPVVYFGGEADYVRADVVDQAGALDFGGVHKFQECGGAGGVFFYFVVIAAAAFDQFQRGGVDHSVRIDVNVNVNDWRQFLALLTDSKAKSKAGGLKTAAATTKSQPKFIISALSQTVDFLLVEAQDNAAAGYDHGAANQIWLAYHHAD